MTTTASTAPIMDHDRRNPYGVTGTALANTSNAAEALVLAGLDWTVTKEQLQSVTIDEEGGVHTHVFEDKYATVRNNADGSKANLGVVGTQFEPIQNLWVAELLQTAADSSDGVFKAAGATHRGSKTFVEMGLPEGIMIGGRDAVNISMVVFNFHGGEGCATGIPTAQRLYCTNQFPSLKKTETKFSIRHTAGGIAKWDVEEIRRAIGLTFAYAKEIETIGNVLVESPMSAAEFAAFVDVLSPATLDKRTNEERPASALRRLQLKDIFTGAENLENVRGTRWAALQAATEYEDWFRPVQKGATHESRMVAHLGDSFKLKAQSLLLAR